MRFSVVLLVALSAAMSGFATPVKTSKTSKTSKTNKNSGHGSARPFTPRGSACGIAASSKSLVATVDAHSFNGLCGDTIRVTYKGKSTTATIIDSCPSCSTGSIELSPPAFAKLSPKSTKPISGVTWTVIAKANLR